MLWTKEHEELMAAFKRDFKHRRLDTEHRDMWPSGNIFQDGHVNTAFLGYRMGYAYGKRVGFDEGIETAEESSLVGTVKESLTPEDTASKEQT